ncbi:MAG TPA: M4 family metallopeptidase [Thermoanaerobaculia bacterium]|nr:M4 family metallopeptidase [Thermoanaerobaculia bacterium]
MKRLFLSLFILSLATVAGASELTHKVGVKPLPRREGETRAAARSNEPRDIREVAAALRTAISGKASASSRTAALPPRTASFARSSAMTSVSYRENGTPRQIIPARTISSSSMAAMPSMTALDSARIFLRDNRGLLKLDDPDRELVVTSQSRDERGHTQIRFEQTANGITVWPAELLMHVDTTNSVELVEGAFIPTPRRLTRVPFLSASNAIARARNTCSSNDTSASIPELIVHARDGKRPRLAWKLTIRESLTRQWLVVIDATNGAVLERFNNVPSEDVVGSGKDLSGTTRSLHLWRDGGRYLLLDTSKAMFDGSSQPPAPQTTRGGIFIADATNLPATDDPQELPDSMAVVQSSNPNSWPVADSVSAAFWLSQTYDYYLARHGRNSIDGNKGTIMGVVRLGRSFENAFWLDEQQLMVFGDGDTYAGSLDVIAHEMTHGVTANTARLVYQGQSGALNEAISDIFGEMVESRFRNGGNDWVIGSQLHTAIRSMSDPARFGDPAKMSQFLHTQSDNGGVHTNSGIINRAFYLLAEGLPGAVGKEAAEKIFYRALTQHLTKDAQFIDARIAAITSANELFGASSAQAAKTAEAFDAVEIFAASSTPDDKPIPVVAGADSTLFLYRDATSDAWFLGRRELQSDGDNGKALSHFDATPSRPAVTADGSLAAFVDSLRDICLIPTNGSQEEVCAGLPQEGIRVSSVGMSPDGARFGVVLLGDDGEPENRILVVDTSSDDATPYEVSTPSYDGDTFGEVRYADTMTFTHDGQFLVYDALNDFVTNGEPWGAWSIYALDLDTSEIYTVVPAIEGLDIGFPALGHTSDDLLTFEAYDPAAAEAAVYTANLDSGDFVEVVNATNNPIATVPGYTGDDRAIVLTAKADNPSGASLYRVNLNADHLSPSGNPSLWLSNGAYGVIYRRGTYSGPTTNPGTISTASATIAAIEGSVVTVGVVRNGGNKGAVSVTYSTANGSASAGSDYQATSGALTWADGEMGVKTFQVRLLADNANEATETMSITLSGATNGATVTSPTSTTISIANKSGTTSAPKKHRGVHH